MSERAVKHTYICATDSWAKEETTVSIAPHSFARGGMRKCHECAETADGYRTDSVAKFSMIHRGSGARTAAFADAKMQMVAEYWAQQFNRASPADAKIAFVVAQVLELPGRPDGPQRWASLEPMLRGRYEKHNNNAGAVLSGSLAQAFSHFTHHASGGELCICDIQGVGGSLFTDPQIHSRSSAGGSFGDGNLGASGIARFLATHRCGPLCASLGLPKVEPKARPSGGGGGGGGMPMMMGGGGGGGMPMMMGGGAGMTVGAHKMLERMMREMMAGAAAAGCR